MSWFRRDKEGILTSTSEKKEAPDGLWTKCPECKKPSHIKELIANAHVCPHCNYHIQIGSQQYFALLFDDGKFTELDADMRSADPLSFTDTKPYLSRVADTERKTGLKDAVRTGFGTIETVPVTIACMDFGFIGGSMGSVVGEKVARAIRHAIDNKTACIVISRTGGARMMEGNLSLMQMAKTSAMLALLAQAGLPYISIMTNPTTGGVTASYAMLGDFNIAEPNALIGFAGPRVIRETIGKELPAGFQTSEFLVEHGFLDFITDRRQMRERIGGLLKMLQPYGA